MYDRVLENRLHLFEDIASDNHDTIYELLGAFFDLCKMLSQKNILTNDEFNNIVNKRRYCPPVEECNPVRGDRYTTLVCVVKGGAWERSLYRCKKCGGEMEMVEPFNYCPYCGRVDRKENTQETHKEV